MKKPCGARPHTLGCQPPLNEPADLLDRLHRDDFKLLETLLAGSSLRFLFRNQGTEGIGVMREHFNLTFELFGVMQYHPEFGRQCFTPSASLRVGLNLHITHPQDNVRIDIHDPAEVRNWCKALNCTEAQLKSAVAIAGTWAKDVRAHLGK